MIPTDVATPYQRCTNPWIYDRIEVTGSLFTEPRKGTHLSADFERARESIRFSLLRSWHCEFASGPNQFALASYCATVTGCGGFFGMANGRRVN